MDYFYVTLLITYNNIIKIGKNMTFQTNSQINSQENSIKEACAFVHQILQDAFRVESGYFQYPYEGLKQIDRKIRADIWGGRLNLASNILNTLEKYGNKKKPELVLVKNVPDSYYIIAILSEEPRPDFFYAGPFREREFTASFFKKSFPDHKATAHYSDSFKNFYQTLPLVDPVRITDTLRHLLEAFIPGFSSVALEFIDHSQNLYEETQNNDENFYQYYAENYSEHMHHFVKAIKEGDSETAFKTLTSLMDFSGMAFETSVRPLRRELNRINMYCANILFDTQLHTAHILQLYHSFDKRIDSEDSPIVLSRMAHEIIRKYCFLAKNYMYSDYSYLIRSIIHYITQHIAENLTLAMIADYFQKNPSYLSGQFSAEVGVSLTAYIRQAKIRAAIQRFNMDDISVSEAASAVGIHDYGYFSKLFKKETGVTPSQYKKMLWDKK